MTDLSVQPGARAPIPSRVVRAEPAQRDALAAVMAAAFDHDPISAWLFPEAGSREAVQRRLFAHVLDMVLADGEVYTTEAGTGLTMWLPVDPAAPADPAAAAEAEEGLSRALGEDAERFAVLGAALDAAHPAHEAHAYLPFVGVAPQHQGRGVGTRLIRDRLAALDAAGTPAYLEASCPRNQRLYERLGFAPFGAPIPLPDGPELLPMWRPAGAGRG